MLKRRQPSSICCGVPEVMKTLKFAGKLEVYRRLKTLTIADLALKCEVPAATMERLLTGHNAPTAANLKRIERALKIDFDPEDFEQESI